MKKLAIAGVTILAVLFLSACSNKTKTSDTSSYTTKISSSKTKKSIPTGYVKIPNTYFKSKEQVEKEFKQAGLTPKFFVTSFDEKADINKRKITSGMCDQLDNQPNLQYFGVDAYGKNYGFYAKKGSILTIGYSDHDYTPASSKNNSSESGSDENSVPASRGKEHSESTDVSSLLSEYDSFIQKIKDASNIASGMDAAEKKNAVADLIQEQISITKKYDNLKKGKLTSKESTDLLNKSIDMLQEYNKLIAKLQDRERHKMASINDIKLTDKIIYVNNALAGVDSLGMRQLLEEKTIKEHKDKNSSTSNTKF